MENGVSQRRSFLLLLLLSQLVGSGGVDEREQTLPREALRHVTE